MPGSYVGLDGHSKRTQYVVQHSGGRVKGRGDVSTTLEGLRELKKKYGLRKGQRVALETGTMANYIARLLQQLELEPVVIDAREVRSKAHRPRQKSDNRDAFEVCDGHRRDQYRAIVHIPPLQIQILRETLSRRRHFVRVQNSEVNAAKHVLRSSGLQHLTRPLRSETAWRKLLSQVEDSRLHSQIEFHRQVWRAAAEQITQLETSLVEQSQALGDDFKRLQTAPSVGPIVALTTIATFSDVTRFQSAKHAASYVGIVPSTNQSGDRDWHGHITKEGAPELRAMLCEAAHHASRTNHPLNPYFSRLCARRGYKMAVVAVAHRLCRILYAMLRDKTEFEISKLAIEAGRFEKKIVKPYRLKPRRH